MRQDSLALPALAVLLFAGTPARAEVATYAIDPARTVISFEIGHFGLWTHRGRFDKTDGTLKIDRLTPAGKSSPNIELNIDTRSIATGAALVDRHLQGPGYLNVDAFPGARFVSNRWYFNGDHLVAVAGALTLVGKTNPVLLRADSFTCAVGASVGAGMPRRDVCRGAFDATLARSQWGLTFGAHYGLPDNAHLVVRVEAVRQ